VLREEAVRPFGFWTTREARGEISSSPSSELRDFLKGRADSKALFQPEKGEDVVVRKREPPAG